MDDFDYKKYSLQKLEDWVCDSISSGGATPQEVYDTIISAITEYHEHHKKGFDYTTELLSLLKGNHPVDFDDESYEAVKKEYEYYEGSTTNSLTEKYRKQVETELLQAKINAKSSWNDGWTQKYYQDRVKKLEKWLGISEEKTLSYDEAIAKGWTMTDDGFWIPPQKEDKVIKWRLPVEIDGPSGEYFIQFPDDLLEAANLQEGDTVEWVDRGDGSYLIRKVTNSLGPDEC